MVQGVIAGRLEGFRFEPTAGASRAVVSAANRALRAGLRERVTAFGAEPDEAFSLSPEGRLLWRGASVGRLGAGDEMAAPRVDVLSSELLDPPLRESVRRRLAAFVEAHLAARLAPLFGLQGARLSGPARGLAFSIAGSLGSVTRRSVVSLLRDLSPPDRRALESLEVWIGRRHVFLASLLDRDAVRLRGLLWSVSRGLPEAPALDGRGSAPADPRMPREACAASGYEVMGPLAVRVDRLERLLVAAHRRARQGPFAPDEEMRSILGCEPAALAGVLRAAGFRTNARGELEPPAQKAARVAPPSGTLGRGSRKER